MSRHSERPLLRHRGGNRERGAVAIVALWGMALVFVLLAAATVTSRSEVMIAGNSVAASRARHLAEAGTQLGLFRLLRRRAGGTIVFDGTPEVWRDGSARVAIAIVDESGKIDINQAPMELLAGLFVAVGRSREQATLLACDIVERRDGSGTGCPVLVQGMGETLRLPHPFVAPEELGEIPGIDDALYAAIADDVTVATGASAIDPMVAPRTVLLAIPGATPDIVDGFLAQRAMQPDLPSSAAGVAAAAAARYLVATPSRDFTIDALATLPGGGRFRAALQVRLGGPPANPYRVIAWRTPPMRPPSAPARPQRSP